MELSHWCLSSDDTRNIETKFLDSLFEIDEYDIRQNLKAIPSSVNDYLATVPDLTGVAHSWLRQFVLVNFWLRPILFFCVENKNIVYYSFFAVAFSSSKND